MAVGGAGAEGTSSLSTSHSSGNVGRGGGSCCLCCLNKRTPSRARNAGGSSRPHIEGVWEYTPCLREATLSELVVCDRWLCEGVGAAFCRGRGRRRLEFDFKVIHQRGSRLDPPEQL